uniref:Uncharacterized protein n=1 Tax=Rhizophora mucronata TaxID=61149 RepID=A0A2P2N7R7_RHIMU
MILIQIRSIQRERKRERERWPKLGLQVFPDC